MDKSENSILLVVVEAPQYMLAGIEHLGPCGYDRDCDVVDCEMPQGRF
jgi:hypothetical protein